MLVYNELSHYYLFYPMMSPWVGDHEISSLLNGGVAKSQALFIGGIGKNIG